MKKFTFFFKNKNILKIFLIAIVILAALAVTSLYVIKKLSYSLIENNFSNFIGLKIELIKPKTNLYLNFDLDFSAEEINIYNLDKTKKFITTTKPKLRIKPLSFLVKKINIKNSSAEKIKISTNISPDGSIDLFNNINFENIKKIKFENYDLRRIKSNINNINFEINDKKNENQIIFDLNDSDLFLSKKHNSLKISQNGTIKTIYKDKNNLSTIKIDTNSIYPITELKKSNFDVKIENIDIFVLSGIFKRYISKDILNVSGISNLIITNSSEEKNEIKANISDLALTLENKKIAPYKNIDFSMLFDINNSDFEIIDAKINSNELDVNFKGLIKKLISKKPEISLETKITNTELNNFVYFLPDNLIFYRPEGIPSLKKSNLHSKLDGNITLNTHPFEINGSLRALNAHIPEFPKSSKQNDINIAFMKDKMRVYTRIFTPQNEYVVIDGFSDFDKSLSGKYDIKSSSKIDLNFAKSYLVPIQQIIGFNIGPLPIMNVSGTGNIDIKTKGTLFDAQIFGIFNATNATAQIEGLDAKLTNANCKLVFDNRTLLFKEIKGKLDSADFSLTGKANTKGEIELNSNIQNVKISQILKIISNSEFSQKYNFLTKNISATSGNANVDLSLKGIIKDYEDKEFLSKLAHSGLIEFKNNTIIFSNKLKINSLKGNFEFGDKQKADLALKLMNSPLEAKLEINSSLDEILANKNVNVRTSINSNNLKSSDILSILLESNILSKKQKELLSELEYIKFAIETEIKSNGLISLNNIDLSKFRHFGYIKGLNQNENNVKFNSGLIKLNQNRVTFDHLETTILEGKVKFNGHIDNIFSSMPQNNFFVSLKNINLDKLENYTKKIKLQNSTLNNALIVAKGNDFKIENANISYQNMPVFLNAQVKNIYGKKLLLADFSTILNEQTVDGALNTFLVSPIKIKNEIPVKGSFKGQIDDYSLNFLIKLPKDSDISFSGSNLGDLNYLREISGKIDVNKNVANIKNLKIIKYIKNQNNKTNPMVLVKAEGKISQKEKDFYFENFKFITQNPTNVRLLNLIFKKSLLKKGNFECNLNLNGPTNLPKAIGKFNLSDLDIPLYDTQIDNIKFNLNNNYIDGEINAKNKISDIKLILKAINKFTLPIEIENLEILSKKLDVKNIIENKQENIVSTDINLKSDSIKQSDIIIKKGNFDLKEVNYDNIYAENLKGNFAHENEKLELNNVKLDIAKGNISAKGKYNFKNSKLEIDANLIDCDANILAEQFLKLNNQIFGKMNGNAHLSAKTNNTTDLIKNLKSEINFSVENGKMPKLGSLEYLLRAGNLIKSGIFGLSLNNVIQILTPYKTGDFEVISGDLQIEDAEIKNLEIFSKGKNLSLYLQGNYSILENFANIKIYGKLSKNISNALGKVGNASLSQFFSTVGDLKDKKAKNPDMENFEKIPSIEIENPEPRFFKAKVFGDINKENYIKSFNWE